jgi:hypothetical protein
MDLDEQLRRARAAVAEAGYDPETVHVGGGFTGLRFNGEQLPPEVAWRALVVCEIETACYACWHRVALDEHGTGLDLWIAYSRCANPGSADCGLGALGPLGSPAESTEPAGSGG